MKNMVSEGKYAPYTNGTGNAIASGDVVPLADGHGIAAQDMADGESGELAIAGVAKLAKTTGTAVTVGQKLYWDVSEQKIVFAPTADAKPIGVGHKEAAEADAEVDVVLLQGMTAQVDNIAAVATADGSDAATTQALANALKASHNNLLVALKEHGFMVAD